MMANRPIELWGGIECTINRIGDHFVDQLERCGHYTRAGDLDAIAALGIKALRFPVLWERVAPDGVARADWSASDRALGRLRELGVEPIVGLVHHGSGPAGTHLLDPKFPEKLAEYASAFAARYPWIRRYTPINEPLTTARFAALYGHWYPHERNDRAFVAALLHQCRAIGAAMAAIRGHAPDAELVQTEDAGHVRATRDVAAQAAFENKRRWLSLDLLTGRVTERHPLWRYLCARGGRVQLEAIRRAPVPPAIIGLNYYVTSDRYLDGRLDRYPREAHGGNGKQRYADVEAVRVPGVGLRGHAAVLTEAWERYGLPVAITEAHIGCTREEQMRWLVDAWQGAHAAAAQGADVRAVTAWALLGSWDWDSLLTRVEAKYYEPGAFDVRTGTPRRTAVGGIIADLGAGRTPDHPALSVPGWWRRPAGPLPSSARPILITGANGTLGRAFAQACELRGLPYVALTRRDMEISDPDAVRGAIARWQPWAIVNAAGYVRVDEAEREPSACRRANAVGPAVLATVCRQRGIQLVTFSSDLVFDGGLKRPYVESDPVGPLNVYGRTKVEAERRVLALAPAALVIRTSAFFGPWDRANFVTQVLDQLATGATVRATNQAIVSPTYVPDLVDRALDLLIDGANGIWHVANSGALTWFELAKIAARVAGLNPNGVEGCQRLVSRAPAARPPYSALGSERGPLLPPLEESLSRYVRDRTRISDAA
ncbi:MAG: dTDP-4-dehydrorhamnose reductase [Acidobacteria bacterium]|nr:dTDP-4-dehydrorhamnose reductase [Acidobacteriota bacterium]